MRIVGRPLNESELAVARTREFQSRFWTNVCKSNDVAGCWEWIGPIGGRGYGILTINGRQLKAHRVSFEVSVVPVPAGLHLHHLCGNRRCVRPSHLQIITPADHVLIGGSFSAQNARKTHCYRGHPLSGPNLRIGPKGQRICRVCRTESSRRYEQAHSDERKHRIRKVG